MFRFPEAGPAALQSACCIRKNGRSLLSQNIKLVICTVLKNRTFSVFNHRVLRGNCDRLGDIMALYFVKNLVLYQVLIADNFGILKEAL